MQQAELQAALAGVLILLLLVAGGAAAFLLRGASTEKAAPEPVQQAAPARPRGAGRLAAGARRRRQQQARDAEEEEAEADADQAAQPGNQPEAAKYSRKDAYEERRRRRDEEREAQQLAEEREAERKEAERLQKQEAEAAEWLNQISTENEGTAASAAEEEEGLLQAFVDYIIERKTVVLEELAADFGLRVQDVIARVVALDAMGRISGIMDDRGKFIYISKAEMEAVAGFIKQKGRVAISELAAKSNQFIDLEAKEGAPAHVAAVDFDLEIEAE